MKLPWFERAPGKEGKRYQDRKNLTVGNQSWAQFGLLGNCRGIKMNEEKYCEAFDPGH